MKTGKILAGWLNRTKWAFVLAVGLVLSGCGRDESKRAASPTNSTGAVALNPLALILAPHEGNTRCDAEIRQRQAEIRHSTNSTAAVERLGWLFVAKARESYDSGFYKLAEQCARVIEAREAGSADGMLLRGHALHSQHLFAEAETLARQLVGRRGLAPDYGLLGDVLVDIGRVDDAANAYQAMLDLKPDPQGYARAAHIRWLKGDLSGAIELMRMAARGASPRDPESAAWMHTQVARYFWQAHLNIDATRALDTALEFQSGYAPALLLRGRMFLAEARFDSALEPLRQAATANPLPEYQWALSEALREGGHEEEAHKSDKEISRRGAHSDPRTCSLYLATRHESVETAVALAREELGERRDIFTHDALAWALASCGEMDEAQRHMSLALAQGTQDARLYFHATIISTLAGKTNEAVTWLKKAEPFTPLLLPSEASQLRATAALLGHEKISRGATAPSMAAPEHFPAVVKKSTGTEN